MVWTKTKHRTTLADNAVFVIVGDLGLLNYATH